MLFCATATHPPDSSTRRTCMHTMLKSKSPAHLYANHALPAPIRRILLIQVLAPCAGFRLPFGVSILHSGQRARPLQT